VLRSSPEIPAGDRDHGPELGKARSFDMEPPESLLDAPMGEEAQTTVATIGANKPCLNCPRIEPEQPVDAGAPFPQLG
jgi:hypothetical protein